ncbi:MAG TPA: hypothetical protein VGD45_33975 [Steroidobacter sp.]|uniref:hypothetical protein n=1 Tax=Steroidobacter sp. TaxID=1978227 RepID=UPI002EDA9104
MSESFDTDDTYAADSIDAIDELDAAVGDEFQGDELDPVDDGADSMFQPASADALEGDLFDAEAQDHAEDFSPAAVWNAFEEEIADGLDAADEDEFIGRLLGGLGRAAGVVGRGLNRGASVAGNVSSIAQGVSRVARGVGGVARVASPAAHAAATLARLLGAHGVANTLGRAGQIARTVGNVAGRTQRLSSAIGRTAGGAQDVMSQLSQLIGSGGNEFDDFDALSDLFIEDEVDGALPAAVAMAARAAARGLGFRNVAHLTQSARRALVRGVGTAARELMRGRGREGLRALPAIAHSAGRVATRTAPTPQAAVRTVRQHLPHTARLVAQDPQAMRRATQPATRRRTGPVGRDPTLGRGRRSQFIRGPRTFYINRPVRLTITPR